MSKAAEELARDNKGKRLEAIGYSKSKLVEKYA